MEIILDEEDLIKEIKNNFSGNIDLLVELVDNGCSTYDDMEEALRGIIHIMKTEGDFTDSDIVEMLEIDVK